MPHTNDDVMTLRRAAGLAGHDHGWQHAESVNKGDVGGLYADPVVPERFHAVASWYAAAYADGITGFFDTK
ncbi:MAG: hypothetical protein JWQ81_952 [Amycolatopsis sp.]|uniref:hypothetical protein n=1 Tax=Amycolatopsis sp. TaxID=37632 RepID=UPI0026089565|nr:hypothetical protein [Amycolatopsis sp.]MCU1680213.1 hypothetical protein [Amycolatopsis sp.]